MPAYLQWQPSFSVGTPDLDQQHRRLVEFINRMQGALNLGQGPRELETVLEQLVAYGVEHFRSEEKYMAQIGFPGLAEHRDKHQKIATKVESMRRDHMLTTPEGAAQVTQFLRDWLTKHILETDMQYARHAQGKK